MNVAIIPARSGSRRIQGKNIREFHGRPIMAYSIKAALESGLFDHVWVSTEDAQIGRIAERFGATWWWRAKKLAADEVGTQEVARDVLYWLSKRRENVERACVIYATAPMLEPADLAHGLKSLNGHPYTYVHGWYYWGTAKAFIDRLPLDAGVELKGPEERFIDINTKEDWAEAERMFAALKEAA